MKTCIDCGIPKPLSEFFKTYITKITNEQRHTTRCKKCHMDRYATNRGKPNIGCYNKERKPWNLGMKFSAEYRDKLSDAHLGQKPWNLGKRYVSEKTRIKSTCVSRDSFKGKEWRIKVFERDCYMCVECGCKDRKRLHAHHLVPFEKNIELRFDINNGKTLCTRCHNKIHGFQKGHTFLVGKKHSEKTKQKISKTKKGNSPAWNKGTIGAMKMNKTSFKPGQVPWNKGLKMNKDLEA